MLERADIDEEQKQSILLVHDLPCCGSRRTFVQLQTEAPGREASDHAPFLRNLILRLPTGGADPLRTKVLFYNWRRTWNFISLSY